MEHCVVGQHSSDSTSFLCPILDYGVRFQLSTLLKFTIQYTTSTRPAHRNHSANHNLRVPPATHDGPVDLHVTPIVFSTEIELDVPLPPRAGRIHFRGRKVNPRDVDLCCHIVTKGQSLCLGRVVGCGRLTMLERTWLDPVHGLAIFPVCFRWFSSPAGTSCHVGLDPKLTLGEAGSLTPSIMQPGR